MTLANRSSLGRYRIERRLGAGAMGEVYLASDPHIDRQLALKTVLLGDAGAIELEERRVRLMREAKAAGRLVHPHVVTLFDAGEADGVFYLAFEFVNGPDLAARQRISPPLTLGDVLRIGRQAAEGLDAAHRQGIVHRDIKPSNLLLDAGGQVKISDFGIAKLLGQGTELTQTGSVVGSPHYLSPEQIRGEALDGRSDLFSLGVVLYELLTRHRPFEGDTITTLVYQILAREPLPIGGMRPNLPPRLERAVARLLAKDREQRYASARELADELAACEREVPPELLAARAVVPPEEMDETHRLASTPTPAPPGSVPPPPLGPPPGPPPGFPPSGPPAAPSGTAPTRIRPAPPGTAMPPTPAAPLVSSGSMAPLAMPAPRRRGSPWAVLGVLAVLGLLALVAVGGALVWMRGKGIGPFAPPPGPSDTVATLDAATTQPTQPTADRPTSSFDKETATQEPAPPLVVPPQVPAMEPRPTSPPAVPRPTERALPRPTATPRPPVAEPAPTRSQPAYPAPTRAQPADRPSTPYQTPPPAPADPAPAPPAAAEERFDRELTTGLSLKFSVPSPEHVFLGIKAAGDRRFTSIGKAADFDAEKKKLPGYDLPGPGIYYLRLVSEGQELVYRLDARSGPPTVVTATIGPPKPRRRG